MNAFGQFFDTAVNSFGVDFNSVNNAFGLNGFTAPPAPADPLLADYDFNFYTEFDGSIPNQAASGIGAATINEPAQNTFDQSNPSNKFLTIYAPDNLPDPTGGVLCPSMTAKTIELWVNYPAGNTYGQYFLDFRTGLSDGYWITADGGFGDNIGSGVQGADVYANTTFLQATTVDQPAIGVFLANKGWYQIIVNFPNAFTDDLAFFMRFSGQQGCPISVGQICVYDRNLTQGEITTIFNNKCSRYGLSPV